MRNSILVILLFACGSAIAQQNPDGRGGSPLLDLGSDETGVVRALVIGISKYADSGIGDLNFAHRDAEAFYDYLRSKAGGALPKENIRLLTNEKATLGAIDDGLEWLKKATLKGDRAIIYYAGHGKVDVETPKERGYLMAYNTPAGLYRNNAVRVEDLDDVVIRLSVKGESKVIIILDACHAGKLDKDKTNLTGREAAKQTENEIRVMACQYDQESQEDASWGGGRGLFSYHFVNGLKGMADGGSKDFVVNLKEVERYVEDNIEISLSKFNEPKPQTPVFMGDRAFALAKVDEQELFAVTAEVAKSAGTDAIAANSPSLNLTSTGRSGRDANTNGASSDVAMSVMTPAPLSAPPVTATQIEAATMDYFLKSAEIKAIVLSSGFENALKSKETLLSYFTHQLVSNSSAENRSALKKLMEYAEKDPVRQEELAMLLVVELHNRAQEALNAYLQADASELAERQFKDLALEYVHYPRMLQAAIILAGPEFSLSSRLKVKFHYFDGVCDRLLLQMGTAGIDKDAPMRKQRLAMALDDRAPYVYNELGLLFAYENKLDSARYYYEKARELAPNWAIPHSNLSEIYRRENLLEKANESAKTALTIKPDYANANVNQGNVWLDQKHILKSEVAYRKALLLDKNILSGYYQLGYLLALRTEYSEADKIYNELEKLKINMVPIEPSITRQGRPSPRPPLTQPAQFDTQTAQNRHFTDEPKTAQEFLDRGKYYFEKKQYSTAEPYLKKVLDYDTENKEVYYYLGLSLYRLARYEEAELALLKLLKLRPNEPLLKLHLADVYNKQKRRLEEEELYEVLLKENPAPNAMAQGIYVRMDTLLSVQKRYPEQEKWLVEYVSIFNTGREKLARFYGKMANLFPENPEWLYSLAAYENQYGSDLKGAYIFEKIIALDTTYPAMAHMHERVGQTYGKLDEAIRHFKEALRLDSSMVAAKYKLVEIYHNNRQFEEAIAVLEDLLRNNQIKLPQRIQLGDLYALSGKFAEADSLLTKADKIKFEPTPGLNEIRGKLAMYQARYEDAIRFYEAEIALQPEDERQNHQYTLAHLAAKAGNQAAALAWLEKALAGGFKYKWVINYDEAWSAYQQNQAFNAMLDTHNMRPSIF